MAMKDYNTIVVGTDGSALAAPTVARAAWLANRDDADLVIVCAFSELPRRVEAKNVGHDRR
jgi:nucleotide-binding universal stress UspA family protein